MTDILGLAAAPGVILTAVVVFGFAPGFTLRLIVLLYPGNDLRRRELVAELYAMPRLHRPIWVAQQVETALFEGTRARLARRRAKREIANKKLEDRIVTIRTTAETNLYYDKTKSGTIHAPASVSISIQAKSSVAIGPGEPGQIDPR